MDLNVNDKPLPFALRETRVLITKPSFAIWMSAAIVILTIAGPFGTYDAFNFLERFAYWGISTPVTFIIANVAATATAYFLSQCGFGHWQQHILAGIVAGTPVGLFIWLFGLIINGTQNAEIPTLLELIVLTTAITFPVTLIFGFYSDRNIARKETSDIDVVDKGLDRFFKRLSKPLGRDIIYLNAQDHYVKVVTTKGSELILLRLSDAMFELANYDGFRTHRSWWVAKKHIQNIANQSGRRTVELSNGDKAPISRNYWKEIAQQLQ